MVPYPFSYPTQIWRSDQQSVCRAFSCSFSHPIQQYHISTLSHSLLICFSSTMECGGKAIGKQRQAAGWWVFLGRGGCTVHNLRCLSLCADRGENVTSQKPKRIRSRIAFLRVFTKSLEADDDLEFMNPRWFVSDEWFLSAFKIAWIVWRKTDS